MLPRKRSSSVGVKCKAVRNKWGAGSMLMYGRCLRGVGVLWKMEEELRTLLRRDGEIHLFSSNSQWAQTYEQISCLSDQVSRAGEAKDPSTDINAFRDTSGVIARLNGHDTTASSNGKSFVATMEYPDTPVRRVRGYGCSVGENWVLSCLVEKRRRDVTFPHGQRTTR